MGITPLTVGRCFTSAERTTSEIAANARPAPSSAGTAEEAVGEDIAEEAVVTAAEEANAASGAAAAGPAPGSSALLGKPSPTGIDTGGVSGPDSVGNTGAQACGAGASGKIQRGI
ncbi:hypothetical protein G8770_00885 [Aestuariicella hydrocarbonica]|uniref:Uncharacterized protein n=1 Tax=Pseudomaricurvus hydrocarbonicus TaxID=1470433 RepID=A0A9E5MLL1_9GAMM|nr:hypothetical protein [Aestuariicella hydrocarbonica]